MRPEREIPDFDKLIERYASGTPVAQLAKELGMRGSIISRRLRLRGVKLRGRAEARRLAADIPPDVQATAIDLYRSGQSTKEAAAATGLSFDQLYNRLKALGIERRGSSEIRLAEWAALTPEERSNRVKRLGSLKRRAHTLEEQIARARTIQRRRTNRGRFEDELASEFSSRGVPICQQMAVGPYNVDLAIESLRVAVEIESPKGPTHSACVLAPKRLKYILDAGWSVAFCFLRGMRHTLDVSSVADDAIAMAELIRRNESAIGQYGVVGGERKMPPGLSSKLKHLPRVPGF